MAIRGVLFDKDGTLIDINGTWVPIYRKLLKDEFGVDEAGANALMQKIGYDPQTDRFLPDTILASGTTRQFVEALWPGLDARGIAAKITVIDVKYAPLAREVLKPLMPLVPLMEELKAMGIRIGVATNDSHYSAKGHLEHLGVHDHFEEVIAADTVAVPKPAGNMIRQFCLTTGLKPEEIAMVGDNSHDMMEARNGGAGLAIAVLTGNAEVGDIEHLADHVLDSIADLPDLLRRVNHVL
jgi:phosphoglycolate phosphatase